MAARVVAWKRYAALSGTRVDALAVSAVCVVALVLRVAWAFVQQPTQITFDGAELARAAENLRHGLGYVGIRGTFLEAFPPLYSLAIALLTFVLPTAEAAGRVVSIVAGATFVALVYGCARLLANTRAAVLASLIAALLPFAVNISTVVLSDALFMALAAAGLYFGMRSAGSPRLSYPVCSGVFFGLGYLTRPEGLVMGLAVMTALGIAAGLDGDPRRLRIVAAGVFALLITASPYVVVLSARAGHFQMEGKSATNFAIASRMQQGLSYTAAADALDGVEVDNAWVSRLSFPAIVRIALADAAQHVRDIPRTLISRTYGTPLLMLAVVLGFLGRQWTRRRVSLELVLAAYGVAQFVALSAVYQFWDRYADNFIILLAVWGGCGLDAFCTAVERRRPWNLSFPAVAMTTAFFAATLVWTRSDVPIMNEALFMTERAAGETLHRLTADPGVVASVSDQSVYYAGGTWIMLPFAPNEAAALAFLRERRPHYVILDRNYDTDRSYIRLWLDRGIPDPHARLRATLGPTVHPEAAIYQWEPRGKAVPVNRS